MFLILAYRIHRFLSPLLWGMNMSQAHREEVRESTGSFLKGEVMFVQDLWAQNDSMIVVLAGLYFLHVIFDRAPS